MGCAHSKRHRYSFPVKPDKEPQEETHVYRDPVAKDELITTFKDESVYTVKELYERSFKKFADRPFLGTREKGEDKYLSYKFKTYKEVQELSKKIGSALINMGLAPAIRDDGMKNKFVGIWAQNCEEWIELDIACAMYGIVSIPIYATLGPEIVQFILKMTKMTTIFCTGEHVEELIQGVAKGEYKTLKNIVSLEKVNKRSKPMAEEAGVQLLLWEDLIENGDFRPQEPEEEVKPEDIYTICYTSGTTGTPKGAILSHKAQTATIAGTNMREDIQIYEDDVYYSYLPLAHCMERSGILYMLSRGVSIGFSCGNKREMAGDLKELKPTIFFGVPKVYSTIKAGIEKKIQQQGVAQAAIVNLAIKQKLLNLKLLGVLSHPIYDRLIFQKMRDAMGGRLRYCATGAAPIDEETMNFLRVVWSVPFLEGYGPTEGCAFLFLSSANKAEVGKVGGPFGHVEFKLVDDKEMKYTSQDEEGPRGEIYFRGPCAFDGYYKQPEKTKENLDKDGWVKTGDIGRINKDGSLSIIDKKKSMFKLSQGEYVAGDKVEDAYKSCKYVDEVFIYGESSKNFLIAVVVPNEKLIETLGKELGVSGGFDELLKNTAVKQKVLEEMNKVGKDKKLNGFEMARNIYLEKKSFKENDLMTPTEKLKRNVAKEKFEKQIEQMYNEGELGSEAKKDK